VIDKNPGFRPFSCDRWRAIGSSNHLVLHLSIPIRQRLLATSPVPIRPTSSNTVWRTSELPFDTGVVPGLKYPRIRAPSSVVVQTLPKPRTRVRVLPRALNRQCRDPLKTCQRSTPEYVSLATSFGAPSNPLSTEKLDGAERLHRLFSSRNTRLALSMLAAGASAGTALAVLIAGPSINLASLLVIARYSHWKVPALVAAAVWATAIAGGLLIR
jgi:hypothetical protein